MKYTDIKNNLTYIDCPDQFDDLLKSGKPLRVKANFDPTSENLHLGHVVLLKKLREFQDAGHTVVLVIGTAAAAMDNPNNDSQINQNAYTYMAQASRILDKTKTVIRKNSWSNLKLSEVLRLMAGFTTKHFMDREDLTLTPFDKYFGIEHSMDKFLYPMLLAYDSFKEGCDIELGGADKRFNLLISREYMEMRRVWPHVIAMTPLLLGTDGIKKMSTSFNNHIAITELPSKMFSRIMDIPDNVCDNWTKVFFEINDIDSWWKKPRNVQPSSLFSRFSKKYNLAQRLVGWLYCESIANEVAAEWSSKNLTAT